MTVGLAFLLFLAGLELDLTRLRGKLLLAAALGMTGSVLVCLPVIAGLGAGALAQDPLLVGVILLATSLGLILPLISDAGLLDSPAGQLVIAGSSLGEVSAVVLLSLFFSVRTLAGAVLRLVDKPADGGHPQLQVKLSGIGYGFLVPVFFVYSGVTFDIQSLLRHPATLARVPVFLLALLVVCCLPSALAYRRQVGARAAAGAGLLQAVSLPLIVVGTQVGLRLHLMSPGNAAALVAAGLLSVISFPIPGLCLLRADAVNRLKPLTSAITRFESNSRSSQEVRCSQPTGMSRWVPVSSSAGNVRSRSSHLLFRLAVSAAP